jgi:hypothetical protein
MVQVHVGVFFAFGIFKIGAMAFSAKKDLSPM